MPPPSKSERVSHKYELEAFIGSGNYGYVYRARETTTGAVVALKKSRVSIKTKRTALPHEGEVLSLLAGHPSIPNVFAHGRSDHFEYLATELLGQSLAAKVKNDGKLKLSDVLRIADQMLSALRYIHNYRIVHRDIKPGNIVVRETDPTKFCLIDFGIAKPCIMGEPKSVDIYAERFYPVGTLVWASLNSHNGIDLGPRDDLESLGYTLLYLLRGELPWTRLEGHSTVLANAAHIRQKKYAWTGSGLAQGLPREFGQLVDYARSLQYHDTIDYDGFRARFSMIRGEANDVCANPGSATEQVVSHPSPTACPVEVGQLVYVQLSAPTSIEGFSMQVEDPSYWHDPSMSQEAWCTKFRPAVVLKTEVSRRGHPLYQIHVVSLGQGDLTDIKAADVISLSSQSPEQDVITPEPSWPLEGTYCYAFPRKTVFYCLPTETTIRAHWKISPADVQRLERKFDRRRSVADSDDPVSPDADERAEARMGWYATKFYVNLAELGPSTLTATTTDQVVDWRGYRGWFDERVRVARRRGWENGELGWSYRADDNFAMPVKVEAPDSYDGLDQSMWAMERQEDMGIVETLDPDQRALLQDNLGHIIRVKPLKDWEAWF